LEKKVLQPVNGGNEVTSVYTTLEAYFSLSIFCSEARHQRELIGYLETSNFHEIWHTPSLVFVFPVLLWAV